MVIAALVRRLLKAFQKSSIWIISSATLSVIALGTLGGYFAEKPVNNGFSNFGDSLWWTIVTMSTVGYGDKVPVTIIGRIIGVICMLSGPILMVSFVTSIGMQLYDRWMKGARGMSQVRSKEHLVICGWNKKAEDIINEIQISQLKDLPVTIIDDTIDTKPVDEARISFVKGNASEMVVLDRANIVEAKYAIVLAENSTPAADQKTVLTVLTIEKRNPSIITCAELNDANNEEYLREANCDIIVNASALSSRLLAMSLLNPAVNNIIKDLVSQEGNEIYRVPLPQQYMNRPFLDTLLDFKKLHDVILIGIERDGKCLLNPSEGEFLRSGDNLLVLSKEAPSF